MRCFDVWGSKGYDELEEESLSSKFSFGVGLPGYLWETATPLVIPNILQDHRIVRKDLFKKAGLSSALGFPILLGTEVLGAINLFSSEPTQCDEAMMAMLASIGSQVGQYIHRKRLEDLAKKSEQQLLMFEARLRNAES